MVDTNSSGSIGGNCDGLKDERSQEHPSEVAAPAPKAILITFPPSLDSELSRFLLDHYRIDFEERRHTLFFSFAATLWHGHTILFPLLYSDDYRFSRVRQIADHFDPLMPPDRKLLPAGDKTQAETDWEMFNGKLGYATARFAYYHLLPHPDIMIRPLSEGTPDVEVRAVRQGYPIFAGLLRVLLGLTARRAQEALDTIRTIVESVDERLADGRAYLAGDVLSLSDLAFAVSLAPLVLPASYGGPLPSLAEMPPMLQSAIQEVRGHPAGTFALGIYARHRVRGDRPQSAQPEPKSTVR